MVGIAVAYIHSDMLRISHDLVEAGTVVLRLEGQVRGQWIDELRRACEDAMGEHADRRRLVLDLAEISFIDANGVALLHDLESRRVVLTNCSAFAKAQLKEVIDVRR
ncbi:MAG: STAS domain-containing protein [Acidobacteriota bacterium]